MMKEPHKIWTIMSVLNYFWVIFTISAVNSTTSNKRRSPNAYEVEALLKSRPGALYTNDVIEDAMLDTPSLVKKYGYPIEVHNVVTDDGYILELHRIPFSRWNSSPTKRPVALIVHGIFSSSGDYVLSGPGRALAYVLADEGYDTWMVNNRGNYYSRKHVRLNPDKDLEYWMFSFDEMGYYDLKSSTDYILNVTENSKLHYIGHSQGGATFLTFASLRPEYNEKVLSFQAMAPSVYFRNTQFIFYIIFAPIAGFIEPIAFALHAAEVLSRSKLLNWIGTNFCTDESQFQSLCYIFLARNTDITHYNVTMLPVYLGHYPAGASFRQLTHYSQVINSGLFKRFDYGLKENLIRYKQAKPPLYNLSLVTSPMYLHYSISDTDVNYKDVFVLGRMLPNLVGTYKVDRTTFHHNDFIWGVDAKEMVYDKMISFMREAEASAGYNRSFGQ